MANLSSKISLGATPEIVNVTTDYTVPSDGKSYLIFADTTSNALSVTLPSGAANVSVKVIDAGENAGTAGRIITVVGTVDGASNPTLETDGGSLEVSWSGTAWESTGGFANFFSRDALTGVIKPRSPDIIQANQVRGGDSGSNYDGSPTVFGNAGDNVNQTSDGWGNDPDRATDPINNGNYNTSNSSPYSTSANGEFSSTYAAWKAFDGLDNTYWAPSSGYGYVQIDLGSNTTIVAFNIRSSHLSHALEKFTIQGSTDGSNFTTLYTFDGVIAVNSALGITNLDTVGSYRYYRVDITETSSGSAAVGELDLYEINGYVSTTNTFTYTVSQAVTVNPTSFVAYDQDDNLITTGEMNLEYSIDGGAYSGLVDIDTFKALGQLVSTTSIAFRYQMVGATRLKLARISTPSSYMDVTSTGDIRLMDNGVPTPPNFPQGLVGGAFTTTERDNISGPVAGVMIYNTTTNKLNFYNGSAWEAVTSA